MKIISVSLNIDITYHDSESEVEVWCQNQITDEYIEA